MASPDELGSAKEREPWPGVCSLDSALTLSGPLDLGEVYSPLWASISLTVK